MHTYALISPNWGEPEAILSTARPTPEEAWEAGIRCKEAALYSGASCAPGMTPRVGSRAKLEEQGYRVAPITIVIGA